LSIIQDFLGLISDTDIYDMNQPEEPIGNHSLACLNHLSKKISNIFEVIGLASRLKLSVVPVLDSSNHFKGVITTSDLIRHLAGISSMDQPGGIIVLELIEGTTLFPRLHRLLKAIMLKYSACTSLLLPNQLNWR